MLNIVILAAGMGKRMQSDLPKVLHPLAGKPLLGHVIDTARGLHPKTLTVVYGHGGDQVQRAFGQPADQDLGWAKQEPQLGTGHAVMQAASRLDDAVPTLVLYGDVPLTRHDSLARLAEAAGQDRVAVLTVDLPDPTGYGRILRDGNGQVCRIVEHKDATAEERRVGEVNTGVFVVPTARLKDWLGRLSNDNAQGEYYLTDIVALAVADGVAVTTAQPQAAWETLGVNSKPQLAELERIHQRNIAEALMVQGVQLADPGRLDVRGTLRCGRDVAIDVNAVFEGEVTLGERVRIGPNCVIRNARIGNDAVIEAFTHIDDASVGAGSRVGPYARLRPGTALAEETHVGNFVEMKNTQMGRQSKANHLAYVGDATVGERVNIGAGTITCNYDGANKSRTVIEDDAFIGSDTQLVAPVRVGKGATLGAGTTLTKDAPDGKLTISRTRQTTIASWTRPVKKAK